jgi:outer membrane protein TolC
MKSLIFGLLSIIAATAHGAEEITIRSFLETAGEDFRLRGKQEIVDSFENAEPNTAFLRKAEIRTQTKDFDINKQRYSLRLYPRGWGETELDQTIRTQTQALYGIEHRLTMQDVLLERYLLILDHLKLRRSLDLNKASRALLEDELTVVKRRASLEQNISIPEVLDIENKISENILKTAEIEDRLLSNEDKIKNLYGANLPININASELVSINVVKNNLENLIKESRQEFIRLEYLKAKAELAGKQYELEKARRREYISYISIGYDSDHFDVAEKSFSLGVGVSLPIINDKSAETSKKYADFVNERIQSEQKASDIEGGIRSTVASLSRLMQMYALLEKKKLSEEKAIDTSSFLTPDGVDPLVFLKLKERANASQEKMDQVVYEIYENYALLLNRIGRLSAEQPNMLTKAVEKN